MIIDLNSNFYLQGSSINITITTPSDKTLTSADAFNYYYDLVYSFIQNSGDDYYYNDNFTSYLQKQPITVNLMGNKYEANVTIPIVNYDAAFKIVFYVKDDNLNTYYTNNAAALIFYTFHTESRNMELIDAEWDEEKLNIQVSQELSGPKLFDGIINADYWEKFTDVFNASYTTEFYLDKEGYCTPGTDTPSFSSTVSINNNMTIFEEAKVNNTGQTPFIFSPNSSGTVIQNANVAATLVTDENKLKILYTITGLQRFYNNKSTEVTKHEELHNYERHYLVVNSSDGVTTNATLQYTIYAVIPLVQFKNECVQITTLKAQSKTGALVVNNISSNENILDSIALLGDGVKTWTDPNSHAYHLDSYPSIGFYKNNSRYFIIDLSTEEAEAWYDLIGHA